MKIAPFYAIFVIHNEEPWSKANKCTQLETDLISVIETVLISGFQSPFSHLYKVIQQRHVGLCFFLTVRQIPPLSAINSSQMERSLQYKLYYNKSHLVIFIRLFFFLFKFSALDVLSSWRSIEKTQSAIQKLQSTVFWILHPKCQLLYPSTQVDCFQLEKYFYIGIPIADFKSMVHANTISSAYQKFPIFSL